MGIRLLAPPPGSLGLDENRRTSRRVDHASRNAILVDAPTSVRDRCVDARGLVSGPLHGAMNTTHGHARRLDTRSRLVHRGTSHAGSRTHPRDTGANALDECTRTRGSRTYPTDSSPSPADSYARTLDSRAGPVHSRASRAGRCPSPLHTHASPRDSRARTRDGATCTRDSHAYPTDSSPSTADSHARTLGSCVGD
jgi:hypothetical protein